MDKLKLLLSKCKCAVHLTVNQHRGYYMTAESYIDDDITAILLSSESPLDEYLEHRDKMIETDTIIELQFYPDTPVGSYLIYHYDIEMAIDEALRCLEEG
jgi:hypothetical protein